MQLVFCKRKQSSLGQFFQFYTLMSLFTAPTSHVKHLQAVHHSALRSVTDDPPIIVFCIRRWAESSSAPGSSHNVHTQDGLTLHVPAVNTLFVPFI